MWESQAAIITCHPDPSGSPGVEVVLKWNDFERVCGWLSGEMSPAVGSRAAFKFYDGKQTWFFPGKS